MIELLAGTTVADDCKVGDWPCGQGRAKAMLDALGCDLCLLVWAYAEDTCTNINHDRILDVAADQQSAVSLGHVRDKKWVSTLAGRDQRVDGREREGGNRFQSQYLQPFRARPHGWKLFLL